MSYTFNIPLSIQELLFMTMDTSFGTAVAPTNTNACRTSAGNKLQAEIATLIRPEKTNTRSQTVGSRGRVSSSWELHLTMASNGTAGTPPDCDPLLRCTFGQAGVATAGTSVVYSFSDAIPSMSIWDYRSVTNADQRATISAVVEKTVFEFGGDFGLITSNGTALSTIDQNYFSSIPANSPGEKGGLSSFPAVPTAPVTNGIPANGFVGAFTDVTDSSTVILEILSGSVTVTTGNAVKRNTFGSYTGTGVYGTLRTVELAFLCDDSDSAALTALKVKSKTKAPLNISLAVGNVAGNIWTFLMKNILLSVPDITDPEPNYQASFSASRAAASNLTTPDDLTLTIA